VAYSYCHPGLGYAQADTHTGRDMLRSWQYQMLTADSKKSQAIKVFDGVMFWCKLPYTQGKPPRQPRQQRWHTHAMMATKPNLMPRLAISAAAADRKVVLV
jgi:hypothetical protein